jgi:ubiquinone/menaquinone biosynthesis C-methylase UbiE
MPFKSNAFSVITCLDVLEHLDSDTCLLKEMLRMCKSGGHVIITVPALHILWSAHDVALGHKRRYTKKEMFGKMSHLNAKVIKCSYYNSALLLPILAVRRIRAAIGHQKDVRSDFFMKMPGWLNRLLAKLFVVEIGCLNSLNLPFGVSLLLILKKPEAI